MGLYIGVLWGYIRVIWGYITVIWGGNIIDQSSWVFLITCPPNNL